MIYLKLNEDGSIMYPYTEQDLKNDYPNTSFPEIFTQELSEEYGMFPVEKTPKGNDYTKNYTEATPALIESVYYQNWIESDATESEINARINEKWTDVRRERNSYLTLSDWTQLSDSPLSSEKKQQWADYRQLLRDITNQPDPFSIVWPVKPQ